MKSNTFTLTFYVIVLISLFFYGCAKEPLIYYHTPEPAGPEQLEIFPKTVFVGYYIVITGFDSIRDYGIYPQIIFPDSVFCFPEIIKNDSLYTYVPFGAKPGEVRVISFGYEGLTDPLTVLNECDSGVCVKPWNLNYTINEEESYYTNELETVGWTYQILGDTTLLKQKSVNGIHSNVDISLYFLEDSTSNLPSFVSGDYKTTGPMGITYDMNNAIIKIQDWNRCGTISGKVFFAWHPKNPRDFVFWADYTN